MLFRIGTKFYAVTKDLAQDCSNSIAIALELPQSCAKLSIQILTLFLKMCAVFVPQVPGLQTRHQSTQRQDPVLSDL